MKRIMGYIVIGIVVIGGYFGLLRLHQQTTKPVVGILTMMHHPALDQIQKGVVAGLAEEGYRNGKNIKIEYQNANGDQGNLNTMANKLVNDHAKVVVGITTPACQALANATKDIPIVMGGIGDPVGAGLVKNEKHPEGNVTGVHDVNPSEQQIALVKKFIPNIKTLGVIYTSSDTSSESQYRTMVKAAHKLHVNLKTYTIANANELNQTSQTMLSKVDAVIVPSDNTIAGSMGVLVKNADAVNKPVFPSADTMVKDGGVASISLSQYGQGKAAGKMAARILKGEKPGQMAVNNYHHGEPVLNLKQARKLGIKVPADFQREAEQRGTVFK
ncbi:tryptophan ABC transporter substrate-binding protein [Limosilactobacillus reuteri]|jgi:putative ABC transport system substrate-binding protein|uniref:Peptide ABC transporter substrate-binding protein n=2 Tax=Limosilactobacillus reuteri TaxID=1598 RepID=S5N9E8_LIMRT|nr:tryptophan ABC transporter substrate-binding protein [Limosilactobacillus reuteri]AGR63534.1 peptide ABC transporter substrate-binding protein [Limosilactobacillus reuteri TD1]MCC4509184.1 ABC transporter substrate-binding protein [Limosilactobacillus reuteri]MRG74603.1 peptide ABC transporter substrate-binding protein [Limosilactobacillus reuteri]MRI04329.1 peptide ABC transporter substrate-binding protein [Limosilactobacillus reuteri]OUL55808.1 peptide ABC transporter substrate-binding pr